MKIEYNLQVKGYGEYLTNRINIDCCLSNSVAGLKGNHDKLAIIKDWIKRMVGINYDLTVKGKIIVSGFSINIDEHFSNVGKKGLKAEKKVEKKIENKKMTSTFNISKILTEKDLEKKAKLQKSKNN